MSRICPSLEVIKGAGHVSNSRELESNLEDSITTACSSKVESQDKINCLKPK
jgi:hypothetical protein